MTPVSAKVRLLTGDALGVLRGLAPASVRCCVTSPPYWGLRDYGTEGQIGLEKTPEEYVARLVEVFREVRRVLAADGTLWLNLGDSYGACGGPGWQGKNGQRADRRFTAVRDSIALRAVSRRSERVKPKDLVGIPWLVAFALRADGWYLRSDIIWAKPNPMPESVRDRPTKSHEYLFLLSKSERYYYDAGAIAEPLAPSSIERLSQPTLQHQLGSDRVPGKTNGNMKAVPPRRSGNKARDIPSESDGRGIPNNHMGRGVPWEDDGSGRNARSVWTIATHPYSGAHFATFPEELASRCIKAGSAPRDTVLDPFSGSGTTAAVAVGLGRNAIGIELNPKYQELARHRVGPMLCEVA